MSKRKPTSPSQAATSKRATTGSRKVAPAKSGSRRASAADEADEAGSSRKATASATVPTLPSPPPAELVARAKEIDLRLREAQPSPKVELDHGDAWQLLVATILAARSNDRIINTITPVLFERWPTPADLAQAPPAEVEAVIKRSGFFRQKTKALQATARAVVEDFGGKVPDTMGKLVTLPGVARKTGNVVLSSAFGISSGIIVDLHVTRLVERLGFTSDTDPVRIEALLCALFPADDWGNVGHRLVLHGRHVCTARQPRCDRCPINELCPSASAEPAGTWSERARWEQIVTESRGEVDPADA